MRSLSLSLREALYAQETGVVPIFLFTITHPDLDAPLLLSSDPTLRVSDQPPKWVTQSRGQDYVYCPFGLILPEESDQTPPSATLQLDNVERDLVETLRGTDVSAKVRIDIVFSLDLDAVEIAFPALDLTLASWDAMTISLSLTSDALASEPFPQHRFVPAFFPGMF